MLLNTIAVATLPATNAREGRFAAFALLYSNQPGKLTPGISVAPGGTVTVLLGTSIIGRGNLTSDVPTGKRRLLALTSLFTIPITVPAGTPAGSQVSKPCLHLTLHEEF